MDSPEYASPGSFNPQVGNAYIGELFQIRISPPKFEKFPNLERYL